MAERGAHGCIVFPGCSETANMVRNAVKQRIPVWRPVKAP